MNNIVLKKRYTGLQKQLAQLGYICNGTVRSTYRKCGKPNCNCKDDPRMEHGSYHIWTRKEKGKTVTRSLSEKQVDLCSKYMDNFKKMENIMEEMKEISIQIIEQARNT
jgi:hypothetical protein